MPAATTQRRLLFAIAIVCYAIVFTCFILLEVPGLGLGHFFYIPVALLALACGTQIGFLGGTLATALYALAIVITPRLPSGDFLTGILNTRVFDEALARRCATGLPFVLLLGDMDDLKTLNDTHGHTAGNI